jgi:RNA polymerase sigma-70 factor (ECF subfamily)
MQSRGLDWLIEHEIAGRKREGWRADLPEQAEIAEISAAWAELAALLVLAQGGDKAAYAALLQGLLPYLRRLAGRRLARQTDVEDTVQDIFLSIHAIRHTYDPERPLQPWVNVIAERRIADRLRRLYRLRARETHLPEDAHETFAADDTNMTSEVSLDMRAVRRAMEQLPPGQRQAIALVKVRGLSMREAAAQTGQTEGAMKLSVHRALKALRRALSGTDESDG